MAKLWNISLCSFVVLIYCLKEFHVECLEQLRESQKGTFTVNEQRKDFFERRLLSKRHTYEHNLKRDVLNNKKFLCIHPPCQTDVHLVPHPHPVHIVNEVPVPVDIQHEHPVPVPYPVNKIKTIKEPYMVPYKPVPDTDIVHVHLHEKDPCLNGGEAVMTHDGFQCICSKGYHGVRCEDYDRCVSNPCLNGATCMTQQRSYICQCRKGFRGSDCSEKAPCELEPCKNGATCVENESGYKCYCRHGFKGEHCKDVDSCTPNPCKNEGKCSEQNGKIVCTCSQQYKGRLCQERKRCHPYVDPCRNGGICQEDVNSVICVCPKGLKPPFCLDHSCDPNPCMHNGKCEAVKQGQIWISKCVCPHLYKGEQCEIPNPCAANPCKNEAICIDEFSGYNGFSDNATSPNFICRCLPGFIPPRCAEHLCDKCDKNAACINDRCVCKNGFRGNGYNCTEIPDSCFPKNPCKNNATCINFGDQVFDCVCKPGFTGPFCNETVSCFKNPCANGGTCIPLTNSHKCACVPPWTGDDCKISNETGCEPNHCHNGGTCTPLPNGQHKCTCIGENKGFDPDNDCICSCAKGEPGNPEYYDAECDPVDGECRCDGEDSYSPSTGCKKGETDPCLPNPCRNEGICRVDGNLDVTCICPPGYTGKLCEIYFIVDPVCMSNPCLNGGTCLEENGIWTCKCPPKTLQPVCQLEPNKTLHCHPNPCQNGGKCTENGNSYDCDCSPQFTGKHCEVDKCERCHVFAHCINGHCRCRHGYIGNGHHCFKENECDHCPDDVRTCRKGICICFDGFHVQGNSCVPTQ